MRITDVDPEAADETSSFLASTPIAKEPYELAVTEQVSVDVVHESMTVPFCFKVTTYEVAFNAAFHDTDAVFDVPT